MAVTQFVLFKLDQEEFGVEITHVKEIIKPLQIIKVPNTPVTIEGVVNLRGKVYPIFNLRKKFRFTDKAIDDDTKILIIDVNGRDIGFISDQVTEIVRMESDTIVDTPDLVVGVDRKFIRGLVNMGERPIVLLDLEFILSTTEEDEIRTMCDA